jgi:hypothetical protein
VVTGIHIGSSIWLSQVFKQPRRQQEPRVVRQPWAKGMLV